MSATEASVARTSGHIRLLVPLLCRILLHSQGFKLTTLNCSTQGFLSKEIRVRWRVWLMLGCILVTGSTPCSAQPDATNEWKRQISIQLEKHGHFPPRGRGESGKAIVRFTLDRSGKVTSTKVLKSSGFAFLDQAALDIVESAQPFPRAPSGVNDLGFVVGVDFASPNEMKDPGEVKDPGEAKVRELMRGICRGC